MNSRVLAFAWVSLAYVVALGAALLAAAGTESSDPVVIAWWGGAAATVAIFAFSFVFRNSSFYDAYWSIAPIAIVFYWIASAGPDSADPLRRMACTSLVVIWGARLPFNWARGWTGLDHEDWRYRDLQQTTGRAYWAVSFLGIHSMPTVMVFLGCLPVHTAVAAGSAPLGWIDAIAALVTCSAIALEAASDQQLRQFVTTRRDSTEMLSSGLWSLCRHPNYLGEILFWWGLFLFGLAADTNTSWTAIGAIAITGLFRAVSLPMIERRMAEGKPAFTEHAKRSNMILPSLRALRS